MAKRITYIPNRVIDANGIADGASIYVYQTGSTTPISIYLDEALTTPTTNPYVVASGAIVPPLYHNYSGNVRVRVVSDDGSVPLDEDPYYLTTYTDLDAPGNPRLGRGDAIGAPTGTITLAEDGAGSLTGAYQYAYAESDGTGLSSLSAVASITVSAKDIRVTVPQPRRGTSQRFLYRTEAGGSTFKLVKTFDGGSNYFQSEWVDSVADGSLGAAHSGSDTTELWALELNDSVKFFRTHPDQGTGAADITVLTGDSGYTAGAYAMDIYGEVFIRSHYGAAVGSEKAGDLGSHLLARYLGPEVGTDTPVTVLEIKPRGTMNMVRNGAMTDPTAADGNSALLSGTATFGSSNTASGAGLDFAITGAGTAAYDQIAGRIGLVAGYTGAADTYGFRGTNASANTGISYGIDGVATGAASLSIGVAGQATAGTKRFGGFFTTEVIDPDTLALAGGVAGTSGAFTNGTTTNDILNAWDNTTAVFRVANGGNITSTGSGSTQTVDITNSGGGGNLRLEANNGSYVAAGSTNNVDFRLTANGAICATATVRQTLNLPDLGGDPSSPSNGDIWRNGSNLKAYLGGATVTIQVA